MHLQSCPVQVDQWRVQVHTAPRSDSGYQGALQHSLLYGAQLSCGERSMWRYGSSARRQLEGRVSAQAASDTELSVSCGKDLSLSRFICASQICMPRQLGKPCVGRLSLICPFTSQGCAGATLFAATTEAPSCSRPVGYWLRHQRVKLLLQVQLPLLLMPGGKASVVSATWCPLQVVKCLPECCSPGNPPKHAPTAAGAYVLSRYGGTHASFSDTAVNA